MAEPAPKPREREEAATDQVKPFAAWLQEQRNGGLHGELTDALAELVQSVIEHDKAGALTLNVKVQPSGTGQGQVFIADDVKLKVPEADKPTSLFFADTRGNLSRRDPRQAELPLRDVSKRGQKPREIREDD